MDQSTETQLASMTFDVEDEPGNSSFSAVAYRLSVMVVAPTLIKSEEIRYRRMCAQTPPDIHLILLIHAAHRIDGLDAAEIKQCRFLTWQLQHILM